ncbi:MAG: hypothetical protein WD035_09590 [Balneolaceae bacterium]
MFTITEYETRVVILLISLLFRSGPGWEDEVNVFQNIASEVPAVDDLLLLHKLH